MSLLILLKTWFQLSIKYHKNQWYTENFKISFEIISTSLEDLPPNTRVISLEEEQFLSG